ncbi:MAG: phosphosulfolactate synthase [Paracoccaceae bacterium]|nr:phosphosulfolactate synthase [Paracoccaceae bacterium]MDE2911772.1 phosphosulfolactate synthase [Paracoccaceae bacterium]
MSTSEITRAFNRLPLTSDPRPKPRDCGISEICDWGLPLGQQADYLEHTGEFVDVAKVVLGFAAIYPLDLLKRKVEIYHNANVKVQPGGIFFEYAAKLGKVDEYLEHCKEIGFDYVEVSDSRSDWTREEKNRHIKSVVDAGIAVIPESGGGEQHSIQDIVDDVKACMDLGAWKVTVDTAEIRSPRGEIRQDLFDALLAEIDMKDLIFEVWAIPIWGGHTHQIRDSEIWLVNQFGPDVNIANLMFDWVFPLEALRRGVGININSKTGGMDYQ